MGGQTALPMAGSGQQTGGTALGGTPIGGTPGISPMGQPPTQTQAMLAQPGYSAPTGMGSAASALSQLEAARNMMQGMPGQMGMGGQDPRLIGGGPAPDYGAMIQRQSGNPGMGQPGMGSAASAMSLPQFQSLPPEQQQALLQNQQQRLPQSQQYRMGQPGVGQSFQPTTPEQAALMEQATLIPQVQLLSHQSLSPEQQQALSLQNQQKPLAGPPMGMGSAAGAMSQPQKQIGATYTMGQPGTPPGLGVTQQQLQQLQRAQAAPMQRPEMAGGMPQQRPGFNMPQRFQDRLPPQFSQGLGALAQNMRNRFK